MNLLSRYKPEDFLGLSIEGYKLTEKIGNGKIGFVFKVINDNGEIFACKVIPELKLKKDWYNEVMKVRLLEGLPNVIQYKNHGSSHDHNRRPFTWIFWNYVHGSNLREYVKDHPQQLNLPFVHRIGIVLLEILYACRIAKIQHGDLHEGNVLISKPNLLLRDNKEQIWVADFGLGTTRGEVKPKDDREEICKMLIGLLNEIHFE
jgi:serine/threonine protein kinase